MSMVIQNNMSAMLTLNELNRNSNKLGKSLQKVSSGMKINSAADGASEYSISERMRVQIRSLNQDNSNAQNAKSLLKVAEGAVASTVEILRTLKEKAIDAANDTNTDEDRATIQKAFDQSIDQIDDNSLVTFNGKYLFTGEKDRTYSTEQTIVAALYSEWIPNSLDLIESSSGLAFDRGNPVVNEIEVLFEDDPSSNALAYVTSWASGGKTTKLTMTVNMAYYSGLVKDDVNGYSPTAGAAYLDRTIAHELTHAVMAANIDHFTGGDGLYAVIKEGAAEVVHGIDDERGAKILALANGGLAGVLSAKSKTAGGEDEYAAGYVMFRYMAAKSGYEKPEDSFKGFMRVLSETSGEIGSRIDKAVEAASRGAFKTYDEMVAGVTRDMAAAGSGEKFLKEYCNIDLRNKDTGAISGSDAGTRYERNPENALYEAGSTKFWTNPDGNVSQINGLRVTWPADAINVKPGMYFQIGTKASQSISIALSNMDAQAVGLKDKTGNTLKVTTQARAEGAIYTLDKAIQRALDQQTYIGAVSSRLDYTIQNITTASENTTGVESVIRDSDMAKEYTEYMKHNVLTQAAQAMLAQANQNSSAILSLLQ